MNYRFNGLTAYLAYKCNATSLTYREHSFKQQNHLRKQKVWSITKATHFLTGTRVAGKLPAATQQPLLPRKEPHRQSAVR